MTFRPQISSVVGLVLGTVVVSAALSAGQTAQAYEPYYGPRDHRPCPVGQFVGNLFRPITNLFRPQPTVVAPTVVYENRYPNPGFNHSGYGTGGYGPAGAYAPQRPAPWNEGFRSGPAPHQVNYPGPRPGFDPFGPPHQDFRRF